jgi:hypothetical protein
MATTSTHEKTTTKTACDGGALVLLSRIIWLHGRFGQLEIYGALHALKQESKQECEVKSRQTEPPSTWTHQFQELCLSKSTVHSHFQQRTWCESIELERAGQANMMGMG